MEKTSLRTPLYEWHVAHRRGWSSLPAGRCRSSTPRSSRSTRRRAPPCGIADISHMGRLRFEGPGAEVFLACLLTRRVGDLRLGQIRYSLVTNDAGGILDDVLVGYYHNEYGQPFYMVVVNASNHAKIVRWVASTCRRSLPKPAGTRSFGAT